MPKQSDDLSRKGEPSQKTKKGLRIPVPTKEEFEGALRKVVKKRPSESSQSEQEKH